MTKSIVFLGVLAMLGLMTASVSACGVEYGGEGRSLNAHEKALRDLVLRHAAAWATPSRSDLAAVLHPDTVFAYPTARLNYTQALADFDVFDAFFTNTTVTIPRDGILIDWKVGRVSVNWKFSTYARETGVRQVVNDVCLGVVADGKFVQWIEYLDGRVKIMQAAGVLSYDDGPDGILKPWPAFVPGKEGCRAVVTVSCPAAAAA
ncbi:NTF2 like superfamily domain containing protein [Pandoravirus celtis]|uniref:NTF2 like superfamily domain containing protein n=1 Tax=Pandoravirus celtis TaxID=2568002 RepID=A0A4D6EFN5_9VIRU|nr:NTF2 like superfamily domain containing protein [Pandoravirus celtis]